MSINNENRDNKINKKDKENNDIKSLRTIIGNQIEIINKNKDIKND